VESRRYVSIFTKDCPVCAASHPVHTVRCGCGYCFDPNKLDGVTQELEVIAQEERLYRDYLAARAEQAEQAMRSAKTAAAMDPRNTVKAAEALLAEQTALTARAELEAQGERAHAVKARIKVVRSNRRARKAKSSSASTVSPSTPVSARAAFTSGPRPPAAPPTKASVPVGAPTAALPAALQNPKSSLTAKPVATAPIVAPPARPAASTTPKAPIARATAAPAVVHRPAPAPAPAADIPSFTPAPTRKPTPIFNSAQAGRAAQLAPVTSTPTQLECPNCSSKVPARAKRCRCGYEMPLSASQIPSLTMSPEDRAAFLAALSPLGSGQDN
jgi:hypothetical protein